MNMDKVLKPNKEVYTESDLTGDEEERDQRSPLPPLYTGKSNNLNNFYGGSQENLKVVNKPSFRSNMESLKPKKTIRFNLDDTATPPPKEFRRMGTQRKTLRNNRCLSTVVTEKERRLLMQEDVGGEQVSEVAQSPRPNKGFVKSMCRFFNNSPPIIRSDKKLLNRSNSFSEAVLRQSEETESTESSSPNDPTECKRNSGLFRSWSLRNRRRRRRRSVDSSESAHGDEDKRSSPSYSVKSQDSGFSDSGESNKEAKESSEEDLDDPNMTQIPYKTPMKTPREIFYDGMMMEIKSNSSIPLSTSLSVKSRINSSVNNISSLQEGLRLKRMFSEERLEKMNSQLPSPPPFHTASFLAGKDPISAKLLKNVLDEATNDGTPVFSTPVRASFRARAGTRKCRPSTMILDCKDDEIPLRNIENRRRWSGTEDSEPSLILKHHDESDIRRNGIENSMVAVWSQFIQCESNLDETLTTNNRSNILTNRLSPHVPASPALTLSPNAAQMENHRRCAIIEHDDVERDIIRVMRQSNPNLNNTQSPVYEWWKDLGLWCEPECMTYLQSKPIRRVNCSGSISTNSAEFEQIVNSDYSNETVEILRKIQRTSRAVRVTFLSLQNHCGASDLNQICRTIQVLTSQIHEFVFDCQTNKNNNGLSMAAGDWNFPGLKISKNSCSSIQRLISSSNMGSVSNLPARNNAKEGLIEIVLLQQRVVLQMVDRLKQCAHRSQYTPQHPLSEVIRIVSSLQKSFNKLLDVVLLKDIQILIDELECPTSEIGLRSVLNTIIQLGNEGTKEICQSLAIQGGIKALLNLATSSQGQSGQDIRILALRGISSICCVVECIRELEKCNGVALINDLLCSRQSSLEDRIETAGVLAQITSPWIEDNVNVDSLDDYVPELVASLTGLSRLNSGDETFLLVTAALANLTFMSSPSTSAMIKWKTAQSLVKTVRASPFTTLFAKDQVVTVLANMAANPICRPSVIDNNGMNFLLSMIDIKVNDEELSITEKAAAERVVKKSAIALSRLCNEGKSCDDLMNLGGIDRLVELCKDPYERNNCDGILISCLTVLKRVKSNSHSGGIIINQMNATDLVEPKILDSFLEYSHCNQESYV
uniref:Protein inscuteable homologue C-terminal domain-containing protein n=1 Tax=Lepeophtheirus salmonis TaxID=72036 RepID=A0A0K2T877_LEPSM